MDRKLSLKNLDAARRALAARPEIKAIERAKQKAAECQAERRRQRLNNIAFGVRRRLVELFPNCFAAHGEPKRPLKRGIIHDIYVRHPELNIELVSVALHDYARGRSYLTAMVTGAIRIDLDGNPIDEVTADAAEVAAKRLAKLARREAAMKRAA